MAKAKPLPGGEIVPGKAVKTPTKAAARKKAVVRKKRIPKPPPPIDPDRAAASLCKKEFKFFVQEMWDSVVAEPLVWEPHMDVLCYYIQEAMSRLFMRYGPPNGDGKRKALGRLPKLADIVINIPPGTSKSTIVSVMAPVWAWVNDPTLRFLTASYSGKLSVEMAVKSRDVIRSPKFKLYFPNFRIKGDEDGKSNYKTAELGQRLTSSVGGTATGQHAHCIIMDDLISAKQVASPDVLETANKFMDTTASTRKVDKAVTLTILIMQRLATNDPTGHLLEKKGKLIQHICLPGELSKLVKPKELRAIYQDGLLSPIRMSRAVLDEMKIDLGSNAYAGQVGQSPIPLGGNVWRRWFIEVPDDVFPARSLMTQYGTDWDTAYTEKQENSASAYVTAGRINERIYIDDIGWDWLEFPALIAWMKTRPAPHYIEAKASGKSIKQVLTKQKVIAVEIPVIGGQDKIVRANAATPVAESGIVYIKKSLADRLYNDVKQGILLFPKAEHTDLADALAQCLQRLDGRNDVRIANEDNPEMIDDELDF